MGTESRKGDPLILSSVFFFAKGMAGSVEVGCGGGQTEILHGDIGSLKIWMISLQLIS